MHCPFPNLRRVILQTQRKAATMRAISATLPERASRLPAAPCKFNFTTAPGKLHVKFLSSGSRVPYVSSRAGLLGHANLSCAGQLRTMSKHRSSQGFSSLYGPGWISLSISGFRDLLKAKRWRCVVLNSLVKLLLNAKVPSGKGTSMFRGCSQVSLAVKSSQRGIRTEQSQFL